MSEWRPGALEQIRQDFCKCEKRRPGMYGHGPFHLRPRADAPEHPAFDRVVEKCPEWAHAAGEARRATKRLKEIAELLTKSDSDISVQSLLAERDSLEDEIRYWRRRMDKLKGYEVAA